MSTTSNNDGPFLTQQHGFVIVSRSDPETPLERFEALDWAPAIMYYAGKVRSGDYPEGASLRMARPSEIEGLPHSQGEPHST